jgi:hypothetical protein
MTEILPIDLLGLFRSIGALPSLNLNQLMKSGPNKRETTRRPRVFSALGVAACVLVISPFAVEAQPNTGATAASALAADDALTKAIRENNADGIERWLDKDWGVVSTRGGVGEGASTFPNGIRTGELTRKTFETSEPRVRVFDNVAVVTTKVKTSGMLSGKPFDVLERQTDVWLWKHGEWKCVLTHETKIPPKE